MAKKILTFVSVCFGVPALLYLLFKYIEYALAPHTDLIAAVPFIFLGGIWIASCYSIIFKSK